MHGAVNALGSYSELSPSLKCQAHLLLPGRCPSLAALFQVLPVLQLFLPAVAAHHRVAALITRVMGQL